MTPLDFYHTYGAERVEEIALEAGTSLANFKQIMYGGGIGRDMAFKLWQASNREIDFFSILYSDTATREALAEAYVLASWSQPAGAGYHLCKINTRKSSE